MNLINKVKIIDKRNILSPKLFQNDVYLFLIYNFNNARE